MRTKSFLRPLLLGSLLLLSFSVLTNCSVYMAAKQPKEKNIDVLSIGTPRSLVLAELGQPVTSEIRDGNKVDIFAFTQGYSAGNRTGRAVWHGVADVFTLGLWEVVGTPVEAAFDGTKVSYEVTYKDDKVAKVVPLTEKSREEAPAQIQPTTVTTPAATAEAKKDKDAQVKPVSVAPPAKPAEVKQESN